MTEIEDKKISKQMTHYQYDPTMQSFSNRWVAFVIDAIVVFFIFYILKRFITPDGGLLLFWGLYAMVHIILPALLTDGITVGRYIMRLRFHYPEEATKGQRIKMFMIRDGFRLLSIAVTFGFILFISGLMVMESNKSVLHEKISGLRIYRLPGKNEVVNRDEFDGKLNL